MQVCVCAYVVCVCVCMGNVSCSRRRVSLSGGFLERAGVQARHDLRFLDKVCPCILILNNIYPSTVLIYLYRFVLGYKAQSQWKKFKCDDLKLNTRSFMRFVEKEKDIFVSSKLFLEMPEHVDRPFKRRVSNASSTDSPVKRRYEVNPNSTSDDSD